MPYNCPHRKTIEKNKRHNNNSATYAEAVSQRSHTHALSTPNNAETHAELIRANISVLMAGYANNDQPWCFVTMQNRLLVLNDYRYL